jgi:hypothetical protein
MVRFKTSTRMQKSIGRSPPGSSEAFTAASERSVAFGRNGWIYSSRSTSDRKLSSSPGTTSSFPIAPTCEAGDGIEVDAGSTSVWKLRDGKIVWHRLFQDKEAALEAVGPSEQAR